MEVGIVQPGAILAAVILLTQCVVCVLVATTQRVAIVGDTTTVDCPLVQAHLPGWVGPPRGVAYALTGSTIINLALNNIDRVSYAANNRDLIISVVQLSDGGNFTCTITEHGVIKDGLHTLHVRNAAITTWSKPDNTGNTVTKVVGSAATDTATVIIAETAATGSTVTTAAVGGTTLTYAITDSTNTFGIYMSGSEAIVYLLCSASLDYTSKSSYSVSIVGTDAADSSTGTLTLTININAAPVFTHTGTCTCSIATASAIGTSVFTYTVTDENSGDSITYDFASGNVKTDFVFAVAQLNTAKALVQADVSCYSMIITATDGGAGTAVAAASVSTTLTVNVMAVGTTTSCSCSGAAAVIGSLMTMLAIVLAQLL